MIITSKKKMNPGEIYDKESFGCKFSVPIKNKNGDYHNIEYDEFRFLVIRFATKEEFLEELIKEQPDIPIDRVMFHDYFYQISMD